MATHTESPYIEIPITLMTHRAQSMHLWLSSSLSGMFFMLEIIYSKQDSMHLKIQDTLEAISKILNELDTEIQCAVENSKLQLPDDHKQKPSVNYHNKKQINLSCTTPQNQYCAQLLTHFDQLIQLTDRLWFLTVITRKQHQEIVHRWTLTVSHRLNDCQKVYRELKDMITAHQHQGPT